MMAERRPPFAALGGQDPARLFAALPTPCYLLDEGALRRNGELLAGVAERTGCRILLAQKAFSNYDCYPLLARYLAGAEASGLYEARLGAEEMPGKEVHVFCAAYRDDEFGELLQYADHIVFNSLNQLAKFGPAAKAAGRQVGLRVNPECSTQQGHELYDPCAPGSRLGVTRAQWDAAMTPGLLALLDGLHFHTLCEQDADALERTLAAVEARFGEVLPRMRWLNMGGGHHITRPGYDLPRLERCLTGARDRWGGAGLSGAGGGGGPQCGVSADPGAGRGAQRGHRLCHCGRQRRLPYARRAGNALPPPAVGGRRRRPLPRAAGRADLPCGGCGGGLPLCVAAPGGGPALLWRHGHLHHLQKQHLQRYAPARHLAAGPGGKSHQADPIWLSGL